MKRLQTALPLDQALAPYGEFFSGIHYLSPHFNLPTEEVRSSLPHKGVQHGVESILEDSLPLPPAALQGCATTPQTHGHHL